ncbi:MAG: vitamin B12-dependent ribonucleoside-diphosphate reductase [Candidatus Micrarchaeota archaeon]|nr:MAG: vitamin B12-dependent ribonucleoside-diphosphate reductase [Candidatus Micrarchaeota archaeon]
MEEAISKSKDLPEETLSFFNGDEIRARVFYEKYAKRDRNNNILEKTPIEMWHRIAKAIASAEPDAQRRAEWEQKFYWLLEDFKFVPGGRIMFGAGLEDRKVTLLNCYVIPIKEDSIEGIFDWCKEAARTYSYGGGCGVDISILRPKGSPVHNAALTSTGAVSFMNLFSETTGVIGQQGRRGALMITIDVSHPDIFDFITVKRNLNQVRYANISVKVTDEFMKAVEEDKEFTLRFENEIVGRIERKIRARELWNELVKSARDWAEPGLIFWDTMKRYSPSEYNGMNIITTNPCSEQPLQPYGACDLGNINLSYFVKNPFEDNAEFDWDLLDKVVEYGVRFLDDVLEYNMDKHPLKEQTEAARKARRIGLGVTGLADMLAKLRIKYDTQEAIAFVDKLFDRIKTRAYLASIELAKEKGSFELFDAEKHLSMPFVKERLNDEVKEGIRRYGLRNVAVLTIPPVGSGAVLSGTSSGIEPIFAFSYTRRSESLSKEFFKVYHPLVKQYMEKFGIDDESKLPDYFIEAHKINPEFRVLMQATIQKHIDAAISSTVNLPETATVEDVAKIYMLAWKYGCKGITVYREGSREGVLITEEQAKKKEQENKKEQEPAKIQKKSFNWERPKMLIGITVKEKVQQGTLYVTANFDRDGNIVEVFIDIGKAGSEEKSYAEALGRVISKYLQEGGDIKEIIRSLKGIRSNYVMWNEGNKIYSIPDAVAKALEEIISIRAANKINTDVELKSPNRTLEIEVADNQKSNEDDLPGLAVCPECHNKTLVRENGCYICKTCGYTKCE